jgi:predicted transcriptional regulator
MGNYDKLFKEIEGISKDTEIEQRANSNSDWVKLGREVTVKERERMLEDYLRKQAEKKNGFLMSVLQFIKDAEVPLSIDEIFNGIKRKFDRVPLEDYINSLKDMGLVKISDGEMKGYVLTSNGEALLYRPQIKEVTPLDQKEVIPLEQRLDGYVFFFRGKNKKSIDPEELRNAFDMVTYWAYVELQPKDAIKKVRKEIHDMLKLLRSENRYQKKGRRHIDLARVLEGYTFDVINNMKKTDEWLDNM